MFELILVAILAFFGFMTNTPPIEPITPQIAVLSDYSPIVEEDEPEIIEIEQGGEKEFCSCVMWNRVHSDYSPPKVAYAKDLIVNMLEPKVGFWSIYGVGGKYGSVGHTGLVSFVQDDWFVEQGFNLIPCEVSYRKVYWRGENKDLYLKGFFGKQ